MRSTTTVSFWEQFFPAGASQSRARVGRPRRGPSAAHAKNRLLVDNILILQYYCYWTSADTAISRAPVQTASSRPHPARSAAGERDADGLVRRDRLIGAGRPGRRRCVFGGLHVERGELPAE